MRSSPPAIAIISNSCPPYRLHLHSRFVDEIPEFKFYSVFTHEISSLAWDFQPPARINPINFGQNESARQQGDPRSAVHEWTKGGRIIDWLRRERISAVVMAGYNDPGRLRIIHWCHRNKIPLLLHADSNIRDDRGRGWRAWIKRMIVGKVMQWSDSGLVFGSLGRDYFMKYGMSSERIFFVPLEPDYRLIQTLDDRTIQPVREQFGLQSGRRRIVYSGRMIAIKRVDLLLDAFAAIARQRPEWDLLFVGDGELRSSLMRRLPEGVRERAVWTGFIDDQAVIGALYRSSDVLVLPSDREPWALVVNEAAAAGLAIVASDAVGAAPELVRDGVNGRIFHRGDLNHLTECLLNVTDSQTVDALKIGSSVVLREWRERADPIEGLRKAMRSHGLPPHNSPPPGVAIIANSPTPYRLHLHRRIAREVPQIRLHSVFTHDISNSPWSMPSDTEIGAVQFGPGEPSSRQDDPLCALHEWRKAGRIIQWLQRQKVRAVVVLGYNDPGRLRIIRWCARNSVAVFLWGDSNILADTARGLRAMSKKMLLSRIIRRSEGVMPCGSLGASYFMKYGASPDRIFLMPYEPDYELIRGIDDESIEQARRRFGLPPDRRRIVYSGRLSAVKRVDLLLDAFARIATQRAEWDLLLIGEGEQRKELEARVPAPLKARITWIGFIDDQKTISALYRASDVMVLPSDCDPWGVVVNEAAAAGLAIVCSDVVGSAAELVRDGVNGRLFPHGDADQLMRCLTDATDPARIDAMKAASANVLDDWRRRGDPIDGFRKAIRSVRIID